MKHGWLIAIIIFLSAISVFLSAISFGLAPCDDAIYVANGPLVQGGLSLEGMKFAFTDVKQGIWMPLPYLSFMLDYSLGWGFGGMHLQSILWHGLNAVLLYLLLSKLFKNRLAAIVATLFWAIHPLRVESVVWISSRKDVISTCLLLLALNSWILAGKDKLCWLCSSVILFAFGVMAKPSIMVFPAFAIAFDFFITGKRKDPRIYYLLIAMSILIAYFANWAQGIGGATQMANIIPLWYRLLNALAAITIYLGNIVWPDKLALQCMIRYPDSPMFSITGLICLILVCLWLIGLILPRLFRLWKSHNLNVILDGSAADNVIIGGFAIFFSCLVPFLGIAGFGIHAFADRFTILPMLGLSVVLAMLLAKLRPLAICAIAVLLIPLAFTCYKQTQLWKDNGVLLSHTLEVDRAENSEMQRALAVHIWENDHDMELVYQHFKKAYDNAKNEYVKEGIARSSCHLFIEACYDTGRTSEAEELYFWFRKLSRKIYGASGGSAEFLMAEVLQLLHSDQPNGIEQAEKILKQIDEQRPESHIAAIIAYRIALKKNSESDILAALMRCQKTCRPSPYCKCLWANKLLAEKLRKP